MEFLRRLQNRIIIFDGAMGTMLQKSGIKPNECPEYWNLLYPEVIIAIHKAYLNAGADVVQTNTFGANRIKLKEYNLEHKLEDIVGAAVSNARKATYDRGLVALSVGPTGKLMKPYGELSFDEAYEVFKELIVCGAKNGVDLISIETMIDLQEIKAALLAAKENTNLPVVCQMTFNANGRTETGTDFITAATVLQALGADVVGANCAIGPSELIKMIEQVNELIDFPIIVQPNAGIPQYISGETVYSLTPEEFANYGKIFVELGVNLLGGCCGTTPEHIEKLANAVQNLSPKYKEKKLITKVSSRIQTVAAGKDFPTVIIGERINPTARKVLAEEIKGGKFHLIEQEAQQQVEAGANIIDVNVGIPLINQINTMYNVVNLLQRSINNPLSIDSNDPKVLEAGLKAYIGKPLVNSVTGEEKNLDIILSLVKKYGAAVIALTLDDKGIPEKARDRIKIAEKIIKKAQEFKI
ncbi:MAG TPA: dihydropteroate synthase, partial [Clostridia bacterium]|nr:dihydropteroate synthase [Clostridia bacterium]